METGNLSRRRSYGDLGSRFYSPSFILIREAAALQDRSREPRARYLHYAALRPAKKKKEWNSQGRIYATWLPFQARRVKTSFDTRAEVRGWVNNRGKPRVAIANPRSG